ncbi:lipid IV(A) 3-deoxy-D-manno-octulosonic acid transferase [Arcobacter sp. F2176]|uniref:lipid IV(A) 3-deoxy-D-manno-octulosonic acid transferase n=1 Tax=unclassified Arcobacter TaxID=2593671 RepID=UPI0026A9FEB9|nr:lipid IV(A) 3-deoxy-D-manno-octulosonic acid transferase [Arcobacter sp. F2176]
MSLFSIFYFLVSLLLYILAIPFILFKSKNKKYKKALPARFFLKDNNSFSESKIWFHVCSFGETKAIKPIIEALNEDVNISVITNTGFEEAEKLSKNVRFLPYELLLPFWIKKQKVLLVMEAELWYMLFLVAKIKKTKTILINARISDRSYSSYKKFSWFYKRIFKNIDKVFAQSEIDKNRLEELGATNIEVIGNIKLATLPKRTNKYKKTNEFIITAGSTHEKEEELILNSYEKEFGKLIIVPRHPERFEKVNLLINDFVKDKDITYHKFSLKNDFSSDIILVDVMGELNNIYEISDAVILGGAFEKIGGHNPVEPAFFNCRVISGKNYFNQKALFECIENYKIVENSQLKDIMRDIKNLKTASLKERGTIEPILREINGTR